MTSEKTVAVSQSRIDAVLRLLSYLAINDFDPEKLSIASAEPEDAFSIVEVTLRIFAEELADVHGKNQRYISAIQRSEQDLKEKLATIERQRATIGELSTPIIEVWDDVLTLPIVGGVDAARAAEMIEKLLQRIVDSAIRCVVIDVTGVADIDAETAGHFLKMIGAAELIGAHCVLTGLAPGVAQRLVELDVDLGHVTTLATLKDGLRHCRAYLRRK